MKKERKITMNIGIISFLTMFVILCLVTFSVLSLSSAKSNMNMTQKSITHKNDYYKLCNQGETYLQKIDDQLFKNFQESSSKNQYFELMTKINDLNLGIKINENILSYEIVINKQKLYVEIEVVYPGDKFYQLKTWDIQASEKWEADNSLNIL